MWWYHHKLDQYIRYKASHSRQVHITTGSYSFIKPILIREELISDDSLKIVVQIRITGTFDNIVFI